MDEEFGNITRRGISKNKMEQGQLGHFERGA